MSNITQRSVINVRLGSIETNEQLLNVFHQLNMNYNEVIGQIAAWICGITRVVFSITTETRQSRQRECSPCCPVFNFNLRSEF